MCHLTSKRKIENKHPKKLAHYIHKSTQDKTCLGFNERNPETDSSQYRRQITVSQYLPY